MRFTISFIGKDVQLITLIIIVNWSVWLLCTVKVASKFILFFLLRLNHFNLLYGTLSPQSLMTPPPPPPPYFLSLKWSHVLLWHLIWAANVEPKTGIDVSKCGVQCLNSPAVYGRSPSSTPPESRDGSTNKPLGSWGVNCRDAHASLQLSDINIRFAM